MWELSIRINKQKDEQQQFEEIRDARKPFRKAVKQAFDENPQLLPQFIGMIDAYCDKYFPPKKRAKKPVPFAFGKLKHVLTNYVTNAAYNVNPDEFFIVSYTDKNIGISVSDLDGVLDVHTYIRNKKLKLSFPSICIPLRLIDNEDGLSPGHYFSISDGAGLVEGDVYVGLYPETPTEYFDEDEYDEDELYDDEDEDDNEDDDWAEDDDEDEDEDEEEVPHSYTPPSRTYSGYSRPTPPPPPKPRHLSILDRAELNGARDRYRRAVDAHKMHHNSSNAHIYEAAEKQAFADLMRIEAKYAGRE